MKTGMIECSVCHSKLVSPTTKSISRAYDRHKTTVSSKQCAFNVFLVFGDCMLVGLKVDGHFTFIPISMNFLTEMTKVLFAIVMLLFQVVPVKQLDRNGLQGNREFLVENLMLGLLATQTWST